MRHRRRGLEILSRRIGALAAALCCACGSGSDSTAPTSVIPRERGAPLDLTWLRANAKPLRTFDVDDDFRDLEPLRQMIGTARVVGLGEGSHGTREFFTMKHRLLRFLVQEMGFTTFAMEATWAEAYDIDAYVKGGPGDANVLLSNLYFWTWNTPEVIDLMQWMRSYNAAHASARPIDFLAFDMQFPKVAMDVVDGFLASADPTLRVREAAAYQCYRAFQDVHGMSGSFPTYRPAGLCRNGVDSVHAMLAANEAQLVATRGRVGYDRALRAARIVQQNELMRSGATGATRDNFMAENAAWLVEQAGPGGKIILWAHNGHLGVYPGAMGAGLRSRFSANYVALGFAFDSGSYTTTLFSASDLIPPSLGAHIVNPSPDSTYERQFAALAMPRFLVDLRPAKSLSPSDPSAWLLGPRAFREASETWRPGDVEFRTTRLPSTFDLLMFIDRSTATSVLPFKYTQ